MKLERYTPGLAKRIAASQSRGTEDSALHHEARLRGGNVFLGLREWGNKNRASLTLVGVNTAEIAPPSMGNMQPRYTIVESMIEHEYQGVIHGPVDALSPHRVEMTVREQVYRGGHLAPIFMDVVFPDPLNPLVSLYFRDTPINVYRGDTEEDFKHPTVFSRGELVLRVPDSETGAAIDQRYDLTTLRPHSDFAKQRFGFGLYEYPGAHYGYGLPDIFEYGEHLLRFLSTAKVTSK